MGQGNLVSFAVIVLACACLAVPVLWLQARWTRRRKSSEAATVKATAAPPQPASSRVAELEREVARLRAELAGVRETVTLHKALQHRYEELIEQLSPGLLAKTAHGAEPLKHAAE